MIKRFKEENIIYKLMTLGLLAGLVFFVIKVLYTAVSGMDYPREVLEPANIALTRTFLAGQSPYTLASLDYAQPAINYEYPFIGSLIAALIVTITGCKVIAAHYFISILSFLLTGVIGYVIVRPYSKTSAAPIAAAILFMMCHWRFGFISAGPDNLGLFFFVLTLYLAINPKVKHKPIVLAFMTMICFYTKQYFIFVAAGIFVYMLLYSVSDALKFFVYTILVNALAAVIITVFWPLYWTYTFFFLYNGTFTGIGFGIASLVEQMKYLSAIFIGLFLVLVIALIQFIRKIRKSKAENLSVNNAHSDMASADNTNAAKIDSGKELVSNGGVKASEGNRFLQWLKQQKLENNALPLFIVQIPIMFVPLIFFGRNDGAFLSYFLQLWMPSIIVVTFIVLENMARENEKLSFMLIYGFVTAFTVLFGYLKLPLHIVTDEEKAVWQSAYQLINEARQEGEIYYAQPFAYLCWDNGDDALWCGHDGEVSEVALTTWEANLLCQKLFPHAAEIIQKNLDFKNQLTRRGFDRQYSLITFIDGSCMNFSEEYIDAGHFYAREDRITLQVGNMPYVVSVYRKIPGE